MYVKIDGEKVRSAREERGWSKQELAAAAHLSPKTVMRVEREEPLRIRTAVKVIDALGGTRESFGGRPADL